MFAKKPFDIEHNIAQLSADEYIRKICGYVDPANPGNYPKFLNSFNETTPTSGPYIPIQGNQYIKNTEYLSIFIPDQLKALLQTYLDIEDGTINQSEVNSLTDDSEFINKQKNKLNMQLKWLESPENNELPVSTTDFKKRIAQLNQIKSAYKVLVNEGIPNLLLVFGDLDAKRKIDSNLKLSSIACSQELKHLVSHFDQDIQYKRYSNLFKKAFSGVSKFIQDYKDFDVTHAKSAVKGINLNKEIAKLEADLIKKRSLYEKVNLELPNAIKTLEDQPDNLQAANVVKRLKQNQLAIEHEIIEKEHLLGQKKHQYHRLLEKYKAQPGQSQTQNDKVDNVHSSQSAQKIQKEENSGEKNPQKPDTREFVMHVFEDLIHVLKHAYSHYMHQQAEIQKDIKEQKKQERIADKSPITPLVNPKDEVESKADRPENENQMVFKMMQEVVEAINGLKKTLQEQAALDDKRLANIFSQMENHENLTDTTPIAVENQNVDPVVFTSMENHQDDYYFVDEHYSPSTSDYTTTPDPLENSELDKQSRIIAQNLPENLQFLKENLSVYDLAKQYEEVQTQVAKENAQLNFFKNLVNTFEKISSATLEKTKENPSLVPATFSGLVEQYKILGANTYIENSGLVKVMEDIDKQYKSSTNRTELIIERLNADKAKNVIKDAKSMIAKYDSEVKNNTVEAFNKLNHLSDYMSNYGVELQGKVNERLMQYSEKTSNKSKGNSLNKREKSSNLQARKDNFMPNKKNKQQNINPDIQE